MIFSIYRRETRAELGKSYHVIIRRGNKKQTENNRTNNHLLLLDDIDEGEKKSKSEQGVVDEVIILDVSRYLLHALPNDLCFKRERVKNDQHDIR